MSRNFTKEDLKTMCLCRFHVTPGQKYTCPVHGEKTNRGVLTNPIVDGMKVGQTPEGKYCANVKAGHGWKRRDEQDFATVAETEEYIRLKEILFRVF